MKNLITLTVIGFCSSQVVSAIPAVGPNEARFWDDFNYKGSSITVHAGTNYDSSAHFDSISSLMLGENVEAEICIYENCVDPGGQGSSRAMGPVSSPGVIEFENNIQYIKVFKKDPKHPKVTLFRRFGCFFGYADTLGPGDYDWKQLTNGHVGNNQLSAIDVPAGMSAFLWSEPNYTGTKTILYGPLRLCEGIPGYEDKTLSSI